MDTVLVFGNHLFDNQIKNKLTNSLKNHEVIFCDNKDINYDLMDKANIIIGNPSPDSLKYCNQLKLLQLTTAGTNGYVENLPNETILTNATGAYGLAISEHMIAMLLCLMKKLNIYQANQKENIWKDEGKVTSIYGSKVLIIGLGDIGGEFAKRIHSFGGYTIGVRRLGKDKPDYLNELYDTKHIDSLLPNADIVALSLPSTPETNQLMNRDRLKLMKKGSYLLNVGRGNVIDQDALYDLLSNGFLGGAGIDVTTPEPLPSDNKLWNAPNLIITPHVSGSGHLPETVNRIIDIAIYNISALNSNKPLQNIIDLSTGYRKL